MILCINNLSKSALSDESFKQWNKLRKRSSRVPVLSCKRFSIKEEEDEEEEDEEEAESV